MRPTEVLAQVAGRLVPDRDHGAPQLAALLTLPALALGIGCGCRFIFSSALAGSSDGPFQLCGRLALRRGRAADPHREPRRWARPSMSIPAATLTRHFNLFRQALEWSDHLVCFRGQVELKLAVLKLLGDLGAGMDIVSAGEYARARAPACRASGSCFPASARLEAEMRMALEGGIRQFNVESEPELDLLSRSPIPGRCARPSPSA